MLNRTEMKKHNIIHKRHCGTAYLEQAIFKEKTEWTSLEEDKVDSNFANASKVDASEGTSKHSEL